ncbi:MAG: HAMP domain-containing histidine kinase, partial [Myxococcales bacterium]|nr:HAMP domain-containing histidine kinase [Myxococcales bacterium]
PLSVGADSPGTLGTLVVIRDETEAAVAKRAQAGFVNHVAHELKSPLNVLAMYSESLLDERGESEELRIEACNVIHDEVERLAMLVSTLLTIARIESGAVALDRQRVRLHDFLSDALESVSRAGAGSGLEFELDVPGDLSPIYVDKELLRVSINNLLTNATKYNREGGRVILSAEETADEIAIRVRDTGVGIHEEDLGRIFDKFYRSESDEVQKHAGHGLGLHLAREIALLHGADIALESTLEEGSRFSIVFRRTAALVKEQ